MAIDPQPALFGDWNFNDHGPADIRPMQIFQDWSRDNVDHTGTDTSSELNGTSSNLLTKPGDALASSTSHTSMNFDFADLLAPTDPENYEENLDRASSVPLALRSISELSINLSEKLRQAMVQVIRRKDNCSAENTPKSEGFSTSETGIDLEYILSSAERFVQACDPLLDSDRTVQKDHVQYDHETLSESDVISIHCSPEATKPRLDMISCVLIASCYLRLLEACGQFLSGVHTWLQASSEAHSQQLEGQIAKGPLSAISVGNFTLPVQRKCSLKFRVDLVKETMHELHVIHVTLTGSIPSNLTDSDDDDEEMSRGNEEALALEALLKLTISKETKVNKNLFMISRLVDISS